MISYKVYGPWGRSSASLLPTIFPDGTSQVWHLDLPEAAYRADIEWKYESDSEIFHLAQLIDLLHAEGIESTLVCVYMPYGRQDHTIGNDSSFAGHTLMSILDRPGLKRVFAVDHHSDLPGDFGFDFHSKLPVDAIKDATFDTRATHLCFPDGGARFRYGDSACRIQDAESGRRIPYLTLQKTRDSATGNISGLKVREGLVVDGARILIVDDICDGGRTFIEAAKLLKNQADVSVFLYVTHGIFSKGTQVLFDAGIEQIFTYEGAVS